MDRSRFLRCFGMALGGGALLGRTAAFVGMGPPPALPAQRFQAGSHGRILVSTDEGRTWTTHAQFQPDLEVLAVREGAAGSVATLRHPDGHLIRLQLDPTGQHWLA